MFFGFCVASRASSSSGVGTSEKRRTPCVETFCTTSIRSLPGCECECAHQTNAMHPSMCFGRRTGGRCSKHQVRREQKHEHADLDPQPQSLSRRAATSAASRQHRPRGLLLGLVSQPCVVILLRLVSGHWLHTNLNARGGRGGSGGLCTE